MKLLPAYSASTLLRYTKPIITESYFPLPFLNKYILITMTTGMAAKNYAYWEEVLDLVKPHLSEYKIVQIGLKDDFTCRGVDLNLCGQTNYYELAYLFKNASLSISGDTSAVHYGGHFNIPLVSVYGLTDPKVSGAFFGDPNKQIYLEPDRAKFPPSFNPNDGSVNNIKPEEVARATLKQLNKEEGLITISSVHFGGNFLAKTLELIPNTVLALNQFPNVILNIRADYLNEFDENIVYQNVANYKSLIVTPRPLNVEILKQLKQNIFKLIYIIDEKQDLNFVKALRKAAVPYELISYMEQEKINELKFEYCDFGIIHKKSLETVPEDWKQLKNLKFKSNRFIISGQNIYPSIYHWKKNLPFSIDNNFSFVPDDLSIDWSRDLCYFWIYE